MHNVAPVLPAGSIEVEEKKLALALYRTKLGDATILHCKGRLVFRQEAAALSHAVMELLESRQNVVLDLQGVTGMDSAGMGELVSLHMWAQGKGRSLKLSGLTSRIRHLLELTNLTSVFEIYPTEEAAVRDSRIEVA